MTYALDMTRQAGPAFDVFNAVAVLLWMRHVSGEAPAEVGAGVNACAELQAKASAAFWAAIGGEPS